MGIVLWSFLQTKISLDCNNLKIFIWKISYESLKLLIYITKSPEQLPVVCYLICLSPYHMSPCLGGTAACKLKLGKLFKGPHTTSWLWCWSLSCQRTRTDVPLLPLQGDQWAALPKHNLYLCFALDLVFRSQFSPFWRHMICSKIWRRTLQKRRYLFLCSLLCVPMVTWPVVQPLKTW